MDSWFTSHGLEFNPQHCVSAPSLIMPFVRQGMGIGFLPEFFAEDDIGLGKIVPVRLCTPLPPRNLYLVINNGIPMSSLCKQFVELVMNQIYTSSQKAFSTKTITIKATFPNNDKRTYRLTTYDRYLLGALESARLISGYNSPWGFVFTFFDGVPANYEDNGAWWKISTGGSVCQLPVSAIPIKDSDVYYIDYTIGKEK